MPGFLSRFSPVACRSGKAYRLPVKLVELVERHLLGETAAVDHRFIETARRLIAYLCQAHGLAATRDFGLNVAGLAEAHPELGSDHYLRNAIRLLVAAGLVIREEPKSKFKWVPNAGKGQCRRAAIVYRFAFDVQTFLAAIARLTASRICKVSLSQEGEKDLMKKDPAYIYEAKAKQLRAIFVRPGEPGWRPWMRETLDALHGRGAWLTVGA